MGVGVDTETATQTVKQIGRTVSKFTWWDVATLACLIVVSVIVIRVLLKLVDQAAVRVKLDQGVRHFIRSALNIILWLVAICIILGYLGVPMTSMVAVLSVLGLALSLAVQGILGNLAGGIVILTSRPFKTGDFVDAGGCSGIVLEVGLVYTRLRTLDNKIIQIPNGDISGKTIVNFSAQPQRRVDMQFTASYDADVQHVEAVLRKVLENHPKTLSDPEPPFARVSGYGSSAIEYTVRVWCAGRDYWEVYFDIMEQVKLAFDENRIEMTYDHLNVHILDK